MALTVQVCQVVPTGASCNQAFLFILWRTLSDKEGGHLAQSVTTLGCANSPQKEQTTGKWVCTSGAFIGAV